MFQALQTNTILLAGTAVESYSTFSTSAFGKIILTLLGIVGVLLVIYAVVKVVGKVAKGEIGPAVKTIILSAIFASFLLSPKLAAQLIDAFSDLVSNFLTFFNDTAKTKP